MKVRVRYTRPNSKIIEGYIVGASPTTLGVLILQKDDGTTIAVDSDFIIEIEEVPL